MFLVDPSTIMFISFLCIKFNLLPAFNFLDESQHSKFIPCQSYDPNDVERVWRPSHLYDEFNHIAMLEFPFLGNSKHCCYNILKLSRHLLKEYTAELTWFHFVNIIFFMKANFGTQEKHWVVSDMTTGVFCFFQILKGLLTRGVFPEFYNPSINLMYSIDDVARRDILCLLKDFLEKPTMLLRKIQDAICDK